MTSDRLGLGRFRVDDPDKEAQVWKEAAQMLAREGKLEEARDLLRAVVEAKPDCTEARIQLAQVVDDSLEQETRTEKPVVPASDKNGTRLWIWSLLTFAAALALVAILVWGPIERSLAWLLPTPTPTPTLTPTLTPGEVATQFIPQLETVLDQEDWERAFEIVEIMEGLDPTGEEVQHWALAAHMQYGQSLVQAGQAEQALTQFDQAVAWSAKDETAQLWRQTTQLYLAGRAALQEARWDDAIDFFTTAHALMPDYGDLFARMVEAFQRRGEAAIDKEDWTVAIEIMTQAHEYAPENEELTDLQAAAYRERGIDFQEQYQLEPARTDLETALLLRPDDAQAQTHYDEVMYILFPPKRIEINITTQRFYAWEGDALLYSFATSTGLRGRDTATGHYQVLDKLPSAYSSVWRLTMPYWLGIYYVGNIENGIHALPIRPDGSVMWGGLLGQRASYGCIILSTEAARIIYNWAEIGTKVDIHY